MWLNIKWNDGYDGDDDDVDDDDELYDNDIDARNSRHSGLSDRQKKKDTDSSAAVK